ncbi:Transcription factor MYB16 [Glycine soja]
MGRMPCCEKVGLKKGPWTPEEDKKLVAYVEKHDHGNWHSVPAKAAHLLNRTDNEIKNYWNTNVKKRFIRMSLDPITHKPMKSNTFEAHDEFKDITNIGHVSQWESARLEAEARGSMLQVGSGSSHLPSSHIPKVMEGCASNLQDDDIIMAVEAFRTPRNRSIQELFDESASR